MGSSGPTAPTASCPAGWDVPALFSGKSLPPAQFSPFLIVGPPSIHGPWLHCSCDPTLCRFCRDNVRHFFLPNQCLLSGNRSEGTLLLLCIFTKKNLFTNFHLNCL